MARVARHPIRADGPCVASFVTISLRATADAALSFATAALNPFARLLFYIATALQM
jgi:hypothetical protein